MIKDIKKDMFRNQREVIVICDLNTFANSTTGIRDIYLCDRDNVKEAMAKCKCPAEYIGIDDASGKLGCEEQQVKPPFDIDKKVAKDEHFDEEEYIEYIKSCIKDVLELPSYDVIYIIFRDVRIVDGMRKYSYHFIVDKIRITLSTLKALIIAKGYNKVFDMQIYNSNSGLYCLYSDKKKLMDTKQIVSVGEFKVFGDHNDDIYKYFPSYILDSFVDYDEKFKHLPKKKKEKMQNNVVTNSNIVVNKINPFFRELTDSEKSLIRDLVMECLSKDRANDYTEWLNVGWCLYNISQTDFCYQLWDAFSAQGDTYKGQGETGKLWASMKTTNMSIGSLKYWAKSDNPRKYKEIMEKDVSSYIDISIRSDGSHYDVAKVISMYKKDEMVYDKKTYFVISESNTWKVQSNDFISKLCGSEICRLYMERAIYYSRTNDNMTDGERLLNDDMYKKCIKIAQMLKNSGYVDSIKKQLPALMQEDDFLETKLDENIGLFAFNNCVFDMVKCEVRAIQPNDYISITTGYDYCDHPDEGIIDEIYEWFHKWFNTQEMRDYVLNVLASTMYGRNTEQAFYIWTGSASNGKSYLQDFMANVMGKYTLKVNATTFTIATKGQNQNTEMHEGKGKRYVYMEEPEDTASSDQKIIASRMKEYSGDCTLKTKGLYRDPVSWKPQFRVFLSCNSIPEISSCDDGVRRRIKIIDFPNVFKENPRTGLLPKYGDDTNLYYEYDMDITMKDKKDDIRYIQAFAYILLQRWGKILRYDKNVSVPECVMMRSNDYVDKCNSIKAFLDAKVQRLDITNGANASEKVEVAPLLREFKYESPENRKMNLNSFVEGIRIAGYVVKKNDGYYMIKYAKLRTFVDDE